MYPHIHTPEGYTFVLTPPPAPVGVPLHEWNPQWAKFVLTFKGKELLRGQVSINQLNEVQAEVTRTITNHQLQRRYNCSLHGLWNTYPVDWMWWALQRLGFRYYAGGSSSTHTVHYFVRNLKGWGVMVRFKGKISGASFPRPYLCRTWAAMFNDIESGRYA